MASFTFNPTFPSGPNSTMFDKKSGEDEEGFKTWKQWWQSIFQTKPKHKVQTNYSNYNKEAKSVFINTNEIAESLQISHQRVLTESQSHVGQVSHGINFGSKNPSAPMPAEYVLQTIFRTNKAQAVAQIGTNKLYFATARMKVSDRTTLESSYTAQANPMNPNESDSNLKITAEYKGYDYRLSAKADVISGQISSAYMQQVTEHLSLGSQAQYHMDQRKSFVSGAMRYFVENKENKNTGRLIAAELKYEDSGPMTKDVSLKCTYHDDVTHSIRMAAELLYSFNDRDAKFKYGFQQQFIDGKFKAMVNQDFYITAQVEHKLTPQAQVAFTAEANPIKNDFKFGCTLQHVGQ